MLGHASIAWRAQVRTHTQRDLLLERSPAIRGEYTLRQAKMFSGLDFEVPGGYAEVGWSDRQYDADEAVGHVTSRWLLAGRNAGFGEGLVHATTFLLCGSTWTWFAALPSTVGADVERMPRDPTEWTKRLQAQIEEGTDRPLVQVARERIDNYRDDTRVKAWSAMVFLMARYPQRWHRLLGVEANGLPEEVARQIEEAVGDPVDCIERELREWARRGSRIGRALGWQ